MRGQRRWVAVAGLCLAWGLFAAPACERSSGGSGAAGDGEPVEGAERAELGQPTDEEAGVLPGEREPGSLQPRTAGPAAPAIFALSGLKGYLEPCGCSADVLLGGIDRIVGYVSAAKALYPSALMVDAGDTFFEFAQIEAHAVPQETAKSKVISSALKALGTRVTVPGERDFALGVAHYQDRLAAAGVEAVAANLRVSGEDLPAARLLELGEKKALVVGYVQPELYEGIEGVEARPVSSVGSSAWPRLDEADMVLLIMHGDLSATKEALEQFPEVDFAIVGHAPRRTDQVDPVGGAHTLEAYDQGRYVGVLKVYHRGEGDWKNAGAGSASELEKIDQQIAHVEQSLKRFTPSQRREQPPMLQRLVERLARLEERRDEVASARVNVPDSGNAFIWRPVAMEPGFPVDASLREARTAYNASLKAMAGEVDREVVAPVEGEPVFIGSNNCAACHSDAYDFWEKTEHAHAVQTLEERDKLYDDGCIGCHVVGYEKPGGSVIGKLQYEAKVGGLTMEKDLRNVGCETCHGPGSAHRLAPLGADGEPQHILRDPGPESCASCHVPEHSPNFHFESYVRDVTGEGHPMSSP